MSDYQIVFTRSARKELSALSANTVERIFPKLEALAQNPRPDGCTKLVGEANLWRIRVGDYRIIYSIDDKGRMVDIVAIRHRSKAYE